MRQQYGTGRHGTTIFPSVTANTTAATPRHTRPIVSAHSTTQLRLAPYNLARPLLAPCVPPLRDTRTLHRHCSNLQPLRPALPQPHTGPTPSRYLGPPRRHRAPPSAGHCPAYPPGSNAPTPAATRPPHSRHTPAAAHRPHTVPMPRKTPPTPARLTPGTASPLRRAPTLQLPVATLSLHSRHSPAADHTVPMPRTTPPTPGHASPPGTAPPLRRAPTLHLSVATHPRHSRHTPAAAQRPPHHPDTSNHPADTGTRPAPGTKKSGSASRTYSFVSNFSVKNRRLHLAQTNALTQHNQSGAYPLINPCSHN